MAMQRDAHSDDRAKTGASGRTPPVIDAQAVEIAAADRAETGASAVETEAPSGVEAVADQAVDANGVDSANGEAPAENGDAIAAPPPRKKRRGALAAVLGLFVVAGAGVVAWIATPGHREGDLKSQVIALLPQSAQRALHLAPSEAKPGESAPAPGGAASADAGKSEAAKSEAAKSEASKSEASKSEAAKSEAAKPEPAKPEAAKSEATKPEAARAETEKTAAQRPADGVANGAASGPAQDAGASASSTSAPVGGSQGGSMTVIGGPPVAIGVDPKRIEDLSTRIDAVQGKIDGLQAKLDATLGRLETLQSKLDLAQGKLDVAASADAVAQAGQRIEALTQKLAAMEQRLEQPKTDTRAPQARENSAPSGREFAASRAVVAQATTEALRAGAPLADNLAALKGLGVADDRIADLAPYAKAGAPTAAQLTTQWRALRDKVVALDAPPPGASFTDKLLAKAKSVFRITWAGQGAQNSIGSTVARVDMALQRADLTGAVAACSDLPAVAKNLVADWQTAAAARLKADAAARNLLSESISAIGRSSSQ